ncbi:histidine kinase [Salipaludibacillus daqingensis]|uniref:histidine kinase n=1 Tax=Salipaludibacillus daqingensis TaxID=3041001 RepID=UPI002474053F|nr:histidine kinase [Salipaludibacillus daqingensis]
MKRLLTYLKNKSVRTKILIMTIGLIFLMGMTFSFVMRELITAKLTEDLHLRAETVANDLASRSSDYVILNDIYSLYKLFDETISNHNDIEYIFLVDSNQDVYLDSFGEEYSVSDELLFKNMIDYGRESERGPSLIEFDSPDGKIHDVAAPVSNINTDYIRVGLNESEIEKAVNEMTIIISFTTLLLSALGALISIFFTNFIYRDMKRLMNGIRKVKDGDLSQDIIIKSKDEIGKLGEEFNEMTTHLYKQKAKNEKYLEDLKRRNSQLLLLQELAVSSSDEFDFQKVLDRVVTNIGLEFSLVTFKIAIYFSNQEFQAVYNNKDLAKTQFLEKSYIIEKENIYYGEINCTFNESVSEHSVKYFESLGKQLAIIVENAKLWKELTHKEEIREKLLERLIYAQEEERKRIARELHDETSQSLTSILVSLKLLKQKMIDDSHSEEIDQIKQVARHTLEEIHYISYSLRPSVLDDLGLIAAIERYTEEFMGKYSIDIDTQVMGFKSLRLPTVIEVTIYRVIQEALTNIARHAKAENVSIILEAGEKTLSIIIEDDGIGFNVKEINHQDTLKKHLGLKGMQERVELIGGKFYIESHVEIGTTIYIKNISIERGEFFETEDLISG